MRSPRVMIVFLLLALIAMATPAGAAGPLDGAYVFTLNIPDAGDYQFFLVVLQNNEQLGMSLLDPAFAEWTYGFGTLSAGHVTGTFIYPADGTEYGHFDLQFQEGGIVTGTITLINLDDARLPLSGTKFF
jgi:hypothetical protein